MDTHGQHEYFYILDDDNIPAFAVLAVDAKSKVDEDTFDMPCYLFFATSTSGNSFELSLNNKQRELLRFGEHQDALPEELAEQPVHVYLMAHSRTKKRFSKSLYLGVFTAGG